MAKSIRQRSGKGSRRGGRRSTTWRKGQSGNLKGRPKIPAPYKEAIAALDPMAGQALGEILADPAHKDRARIAEYVWNRNHGMPKQRVEASGPDGAPIPIKAVLTSEEKRARLASILATGAARLKEGGAPESEG